MGLQITREHSIDFSAAPECVVCRAPALDARCGECGATVAPGGYRLERLLAKTAHSRVFLAEDPQGHRVALKELLFAQVPDAQALDAFEREAALLKQLDHPAIPKFRGSFSEGQGASMRLYVAEEFVAGETLLSALERGALEAAQVTAVAREVLEVLAYLHGRSPPLLHRDIKPQNLIRRPDGSIALVDFGSAREVIRGATFGSTLVGTFGYMPLEQLGGTVSRSSDLYALGASLVHLLTGQAPADLFHPTRGLLLNRVLPESPLRRWLERMVAPVPNARFQSAQEAQSALEETTSAPVERPVERVTQAPKRRSWQRAPTWLVGLGLVISVLATGRQMGRTSSHRADEAVSRLRADDRARAAVQADRHSEHSWQVGPLSFSVASIAREPSYTEKGRDWVNVKVLVTNHATTEQTVSPSKTCRLLTPGGVLTPSARGTASEVTLKPGAARTIDVIFFAPPADLQPLRLQFEDGQTIEHAW